jgi:tetraacyldisaccharide 4'-kinase
VTAHAGARSGVPGAFERSWSGERGSTQWTRILLPAAALYAAAAARTRARAAAQRRSVPGLYVISVGNLTVGGTGKTSLARWLALQAVELGASPAVLLRGHGASRRGRETDVVPDLDGYPLASAVGRVGDEAAAHRAALPRGATVAVDRDRYRAARAAQIGYRAKVAVLDDGWEQGRLQWDELWVTLDPDRPEGNGLILPAGPLRRPASTLREASVIAFVMEEAGVEIPAATRSWVAERAPGTPLIRFGRRLDGIGAIGGKTANPLDAGTPAAGLLSGVGSPARLERFARASGIRLTSHSIFPDHARWSVGAVEEALRSAAKAGAGIALITEKDEPRWPAGLNSPIPVRVLRTSLRPLDPVEGALARLRGAVGSLSPIERVSKPEAPVRG